MGENCAAQAVWLGGQLNISANVRDSIPLNAYEAQFRMALMNEKYKAATIACEKAVEFHPIAAGLAIDGSFIASFHLDDPEQAIRIIDAAHPETQNSFLLHNNKAAALACLGRTDEARISHDRAGKILKSIENNQTDIFVHIATRGLIEYRAGNLMLGRAYYRKAVLGFKQLGAVKEERIGTLFWISEEIRAETSVMPTTAIEEIAGSRSKMLSQLKELQDRLMAVPSSYIDKHLLI